MAAVAEQVRFASGGLELSGLLWSASKPSHERYPPAVVLATPGSSVKEQVGANYASRLAERGVTALVFDPSYQGESGGEPRDLEDPAARVADISFAIDFLCRAPSVDAERIGVLGVCAGGGYAATAAMADHRIKAVGLVVPVNIGRAFRQAAATQNGIDDTLAAAGRQRTAEAQGAAPRRDPWLPDLPEDAQQAGIRDRDVLDAVDFYRTSRGRHPNSTNRLLFRSAAGLMAYDAFNLADELLTQPTQIVLAGRVGSTGSYADGLMLQERIRNPADLVVIDGAGHYDMYDKPQYVDPAIEPQVALFRRELSDEATPAASIG